MARVERGAETPSESPVVAATPASAPAVRTVAPSTSVDATSELEGRLRCKETLRIDGRVRGEIECEKAVLVGQGARVEANIEADEVQVSGVVEGNIAARRKITLERTAVVIGDLATPGIVIEEGAKLKGQIVIGSDEEAESTAQAKTETPPEAAKAEAASDATKAANRPGSQDAPDETVAARRPQATKGKSAGSSPARHSGATA